MSKILVIGGTRFFGIPMLQELLRNGHEVTIATRGNLKPDFEGRIQHLILDRSDPEQLRNQLGDLYYDIVIDKIAYASNDVKNLQDCVHCGRYILMSSCSVYVREHENILESEFNPYKYELKWMNRTDDYNEGKRQAECAAVQLFCDQPVTMVRYPVVLGPNDYTGRLQFYIDHIRNQIPMQIDDPNQQISFIHETEAGKLLAYLADHPLDGAVNGCSTGSISISELLTLIETKTGNKAVLSENGDSAPYNGYSDHMTLNTERAQRIGFQFSDIHDWIETLIE